MSFFIVGFPTPKLLDAALPVEILIFAYPHRLAEILNDLSAFSSVPVLFLPIVTAGTGL